MHFCPKFIKTRSLTGNNSFLEEYIMQYLKYKLTAIKIITVVLLGSTSFVFAHDNDLDTRLKSYSEVPSVSSTATGKFKATAHRRSNSISYELSYKDLQGDVRQAHIH